MKSNHVYAKIKPSTTAGTPFANLATPEQISNQLQVTPQCVNSWCRSGLIPARVDEGRIVRFHLPDVLDALKQSGTKRHRAAISAPRQETGFGWLAPTSLLAFDDDLPHRLTWQIDDQCGPSACVFAPAPRLQTVYEIADVIQTTRQTINMWLHQGIIPVRISSENVIRLDIELVLDVLQKRAAAKRTATRAKISPP